jgi:hypothetical protein
MANVKLLFCGSTEKCKDHSIEVFCTEKNEIFIEIEILDYQSTCIYLDRETAIKFSKELRKQIALID